MNGLTLLPDRAFAHLRFLEELRLAGNGLTHIPPAAFYGLVRLKVLMLQNNQLQQVPSLSLWPLRNLQSLRLDANRIVRVPRGCFDGLVSLRHLWLDDNALTEVPISALGGLSSLQAITLALNKITHIPDLAFANLTNLLVLHLQNNRIHSLGSKSFDGLQNLETLDLNYNNLVDFPVAIKALTNLKELGFHSNNLRSIPEHAFVGNPSLLTMSLNGATEITELPDLTGTTSLESLTITGARISSLPSTLCNQLPKLKVLDLSNNLILHLPSFSGCVKIQKINLHHNEIQEVFSGTFRSLPALRSVNLAWNRVRIVQPYAFTDVPSLVKLDLTSNLLSSLPPVGLQGLTHLKLGGNRGLQDLLSVEDFPVLRVMEMPYTFQCCAFVACERSLEPQAAKGSNSKEPHGSRDGDLMHRKEEHDHEDVALELDENPKSHQFIQCSPVPGPFRPCYHLFGSWIIRSGVWVIVVLSLICNVLVASTILLSPVVSSAKHLVGLLAVVNILMGLSSGVIAMVDALTFGSFSKYGAWWESGMGCKVTGFLSVFASETSIFLLTTAVLEHGLSVRCYKKAEARSSTSNVKVISALGFGLLVAILALPFLYVGEYSSSSLCLPLPFGEPSNMGFMVALVLLNTVCYFVMTVIYTRVFCSLKKDELDNFWDSSMIKHLARLLFTNCLLYIPVAFLSFTSLLNLALVSPEVGTSVLLVIVPLPACLNPLLYMLFNSHFKEDLGLLCKQAQLLKRNNQASLVCLNSEDAEKQSCNSTQALITFTPQQATCHKAELYQNSASFVPCS